MLSIQNTSTFYVDQKHGDKSNNGLSPKADAYLNGPLPSIERAFTFISTLRSNGENRPFTIALTDDYYITKPIEIPSNINNVTIESYGLRKRIIGGIQIKNWKEDIYNGVKCISAPVPDEAKENSFSDLIVNNKFARVTRYPKEGLLKAKETDTKASVKTSQLFSPSRWFIAKSEDLEGIEGVENAYVNYYHYWIDEHSPVESYEADTNKITMKYHSRFLLTANYSSREPSDMYYYLSNLPSTFKEAGEWYFDKKTGRIFYIPLEGESAENLNAYAPMTKKLFNIESENVTLRDLELLVTDCDYESRYARCADPESGISVEDVISYGADMQSVCYADGAISITNSKRVAVSNCHLHSLGIHAIAIRSGCDHIRIENNLIEDIAAGGIKIFGGKYDSPEEYRTNNCSITGNEIRYIGKRYEAGCGILICHSHDNLIENNHIHHGGYSGISVGWEWGYSDNESYGNIIRGNHIHHLGNGKLSDMGGIYTLGIQPGTVISENRIHDIKCENYGAWGIYLDEGSSFIRVENNLVYNTGTECLHLHYGNHNLIRNNIFASTLGASAVRLSKNEHLQGMHLEGNILAVCGASVYNPTRATGNFSASSDSLTRELSSGTVPPARIARGSEPS